MTGEYKDSLIQSYLETSAALLRERAPAATEGLGYYSTARRSLLLEADYSALELRMVVAHIESRQTLPLSGN